MIVRHDNSIFFEAEHLIDSLIHNITNTRLYFEVYGDEFSDQEFVAIQENMRGFAGAIKVVVDAYRKVTPAADRAEVMLALSDQMQLVLDAPLAMKGSGNVEDL
jgi:hypothetical protein